ncbi:MAG: hypothetical protein AB7F75_00735 [Planctomycetota bacterium]
MPFLAQDAGGEPVLFFCRAAAPVGDGTYIWKAGYLDANGEPRRLPTRMADDVTECSPTAWRDASGWHVSFIAGGRPDNPRFDLYRMDGPALDLLSPPVALQQTRTGFVHRDRLVWGELRDIIHVQDSSHAQEIELPGAHIYRIAYRADAPDVLLITGQWIREDEVFTLEYDLASGRQNFIECDGKPAYKCTILGTEIIHADRCGEHFEERLLRRATSMARLPSRVVTRRLVQPQGVTAQPATGGCGCKGSSKKETTPTRPSCLECVEKHLGAAYVLLTEANDGYAHRLRAIGHLHEAEDESQEWSIVHRTIREARKEYQTKGTMPDWDLFEFLVKGVRDYVE